MRFLDMCRSFVPKGEMILATMYAYSSVSVLSRVRCVVRRRLHATRTPSDLGDGQFDVISGVVAGATGTPRRTRKCSPPRTLSNRHKADTNRPQNEENFLSCPTKGIHTGASPDMQEGTQDQHATKNILSRPEHHSGGGWCVVSHIRKTPLMGDLRCGETLANTGAEQSCRGMYPRDG